MTNYDYMKRYLEEEPRARERSAKDRACINLLLRRFGALEGIKKETLIEFVKDYATLDRCWRKVIAENPTLRGTDYGDKEMLEDMAMVSLGYGDQRKLHV